MGDCGNIVVVGMLSYAFVGVFGGVFGGFARFAFAYVEINVFEKCLESFCVCLRGLNSVFKLLFLVCFVFECCILKDKVFGTVFARNFGARAR